MRTRYNLRLLSGLVALGTILPTAAYADDVHAEGSDNSITVTGTTRKVILGVSWVISGRRYDDGPLPWGIMGVEENPP